jgi:hypothetical protein
MSGNLAALSMGGLGTQLFEGGPALQEAGAWYYGSLPKQLATNLDRVDLIMDWGATCSSDLVVDACSTFAFEQAFAEGNRSFRNALGSTGHAGTLDYRETEGSHAWRWWSAWLRDRQLPYALARLADPVPAVDAIADDGPPSAFRYRSIRPAFSVFGYDVRVERDVLEFLDLFDVGADGLTLVGTGRATVTTAGVYEPGAPYRVTGATEPLVLADAAGRLELVVDLGASHPAEQFSLAARPVQDLPGYMRTRVVAIAPAPADGPHASAGPVKGRSVDAPTVPAVEGPTHLPATGSVVPVWLASLLLVAAGAVSALQRHASTS